MITKHLEKHKVKVKRTNDFRQKKPTSLALQSEIDRLDREIDERIYELYGLTEEERKVVEGG